MSRDRKTEVLLASRIDEGDVKAVKTFYDRYSQLLFAFVQLKCSGNRVDAEDIWQETLIAAVRGMGIFRGQSSMFTWLRSIAIRKVADHFRRERNRCVLGFADMDQVHVAHNSSEDQGNRETVRVRVLEVLASLPE